MSGNSHEPIRQTRPSTKHIYKRMQKISLRLMIVGLILLSIAFVWTVQHPGSQGTWFIVVPVVVLLGVFAIIVYPSKILKETDTYHFVLNEHGITETYLEDDTNEKTYEQHIPFSRMYRVLVGNFVDKNGPFRANGERTYRLQAAMIIEYEGGQFVRIFLSGDNLKHWLPHFWDKGFPVIKTDYDLAPLFYAEETDSVDVSEIVGEPWKEETSYPSVGEEYLNNPFVPWKYTMEEVDEKEERRRTKKWETGTLWMLVVFALVTGGILIPITPLEKDGSFTMSNTLFLAFIVTILYPVCVVFWRSFTRWYLPLLYFIVSAGISAGIYVMVSFVMDVSSEYQHILSYYIMIAIFGWIPLFIVMKLVKGFISMVQKK